MASFITNKDLEIIKQYLIENGIKEQPFSEEARANLMEKMREFDAKLKLDREKLELDKYKSKEDVRLKEKSINKKTNIK